MCETRKFVMTILQGKQGLLCNKRQSSHLKRIESSSTVRKLKQDVQLVRLEHVCNKKIRMNPFSRKLLSTAFKIILFDLLSHNSHFKRREERRFLKTLWEKKKMLVTSIFFFPHHDFYSSQNNFQLLTRS